MKNNNIKLEIKENGIAIIKLNREPVNALSYKLLKSLCETFKKLDDNIQENKEVFKNVTLGMKIWADTCSKIIN